MTTAQKYNGYTNYETWAVALWIDNEEWSQRQAQATAANIWTGTADAGEAGTKSDRARWALADLMKADYEEAVPELQGVWADLLNAALSEVDWMDIADNLLHDQEGYQALDA